MKAINIFEHLKGNAYPGRGIVTGQSQDGRYAVAAYFIMGRSVNSRNRIFVTEGENMRTQAHDPALLSDPSLVIYYPVRTFAGGLIVTNGDQTDTIADHIAAHPDSPVQDCFVQALRTRTYEPDPPIYTPRISSVMELKDGYRYQLSILKGGQVREGSPAALRQFFDYEPVPGVGHFIHTYQCDGDPVPAFAGEPKAAALSGDIDSFTNSLWESLNEDNKVSLFVRYIDLETGAAETRIVNKNQ